MSATACPNAKATRELLARREEDVITRDESRRLADHLAACETCAAEAFRRDPTLLFGSLSATSEAEAAVVRKGSLHPAALSVDADRVMQDVLASIDVERAKSKFASRRGSRPVLRAASFVLLATALAGAVTYGGRRVLVARHGEPSADSRALVPVASRVSPAPEAPVLAERSRRPLIEGVGNRGATVYQFAGVSPSEPSVVFVVDRNADI